MASDHSQNLTKASYPLTPSQLGVYFPSIENPQSLVYNVPACGKIEKKYINVERLIAAIDAVIDNHEIFHCTIDLVDGVPSMILSHKEIKCSYQKTTEVNLHHDLQNFIRPFDLKNDELARFCVFETDDFAYVMLDIHHTIFDGMSQAVLNAELAKVYAGEELRPEKISIFDLSEYEEELPETEEYKEAEKFFADIFDGFEAGNDFVTNNVVLKEPAVGSRKIILNGAFSHENIGAFTKKCGVTTNTLFMSAYEYTLAKFNGSDKALICLAESGRHKGDTIDTVGMLVRTLALPVDVSGNQNISEFLASEHKRLREYIAHDIYPFSTLASKYGFFNDFMYVYQSDSFIKSPLGDGQIAFSQIEVEAAVSKLSLEIFKEPEGYELRFVYRKDLYSDEIMDSFIKTYIQVVSELMTKQSFNDIVLTSQEELAQLDSFNETEEDYEQTDVVTLFRRQVEKHPNNVAVAFNDKKLTYKELDEISESIACYLKENGVGKNDVVSVLIPRCEYMVSATLGVLKAGAGYQPLDTSYPKERLSFMVGDSSAKMLVTTHELESLIDGYTGKKLYLEDIPKLPKNGSVGENPSPDSLYVLLYTSGTTGTPKGVMLEHRNVVALYNTHKNVYLLNETSRIASYPSYGFDAFVMDFVGTFLSGAAMYIIPEDIRLDILAMDKFFIANGITHGFMTTQVGRQFVELTKCQTLVAFMVGGESLTPIDMAGKNLKFINGYGPSESIAYIASFAVDKLYDRVPIGRASKNIKLYVVDNKLQRLPIGVPGELLVSGHQVGRGYLNRPEKNAESFIINPFTQEKGYERVYRTGDVVRMLPDGNIDFIGRNDGQVKIRGFRIELTEVESVIRSFEGIADVTVQAFDEVGGGKYIAAYVVSDSQVNIDALNEFILSQKPPYMVPAVTMQIEKIPLSVNGKVDKRNLPKPERKIEDCVAPTTDLQQKIFDIVAKVIGTKNFGVNTDIFYAGLTSIGSIKLNVLLSEAFSIVIQIRDLKENSTVEKLEQFILSASQSEDFEELDDYPLTKTQEGIFVECMSHPNETIYNIPLLLKLGGHLDVEKLKNSIVSAVKAHRYITTTLFYNADGEARQKRPTEQFTTSEIEFISANTIKEVFRELVVPYNLEGDRLFRIKIIQAESLYLFIDMHHIISDGTSMNIFLDDISKAYQGETIIEESYSGFEVALQEQKNRKSDVLQKAKAYYENLLSGFDTDFLPKSDLYKTSQLSSGSLVSQSSKELVTNVRRFAEEQKVSVNGLLCASFGYVLSKFNGSDYSIFTTVYNGRMDSRVDRTMSMLVKTLPVLCNMQNSSPKEFVADISNQLMDSMTNDVYSFAEISREFGVKADVMFIYQGDNFTFDSFCGETCTPVGLPISEDKAPIVVQVVLNNDHFVYQADYDNTKFSEQFIQSLIATFDKSVSEFISQKSLSDIDLIDDKTKIQIEQYNRTEVPFDATKTVVDLFNEQVAKFGDHVAVSYKDVQYTYEELNTLTNKIASYITQKGLGADDFVSVLIHRNEYMPITAMGVVKSGAAYQPLDPTYPKERLNFMTQDCGAKLLIADRDLRPLLDEYNGEVLFTDDIANLPACEDYRAEVTPHNALVIIYTSGTTGTPKGCILEQRNIVSFFHSHSQIMGLTSDSHVATYASFGFDAGVMDIFSTLMSGASLYVIPDDIRLDLVKMDEFYSQNKITQGFMTTQVGRMFASSTTCKTLTHFLVGGEKLVPFVPPTNFDFINGYGPSETIAYASHFVVKDDGQLQPIGKANNNIKLYVVDKYDHLLPFGVCGELCISGQQVGRGYLNRPEKTAEVFVKNPFTQEQGYERMYKTGDVVRMLPDGNIDFIGRRDGQVKVRGFRIELSEIEGVIRNYSGIKDATVQAFDNPAGGKFVAAFIVSDSQVDVEKLNAFIGATKPPYMIPAVTMQIDAIPLNANGKVDKRKLPEPKLQSIKVGAEPANDLETKLCDIFKDVIGIDKVYADDDFFSVGGTSISAVQVIVKCNNAGFNIVYKNLFENSTPQKLAAFISSGSQVKDIFAPTGDEKNKYDYSALEYNVEQNLPNIKYEPIGDVLLTGVTGFLGSHIFKELIVATPGKVICLIRSKEGLSATERMEMMMTYYFENWYDDEIRNRVTIIDCDISDKDLAKKCESVHFDTIINCAANVKHFDKDESFMHDNFSAVDNLIALSQQHNARFIQTSSLSVCGESVNGNVPEGIVFKECDLNIGQSLENKYVYSKYLAEQLIIDAISRGKLRGKIIRLGNLMPRDEDGEFQINSSNNGFLKQFVGYKKLGCYPIDMMDAGIEYSPIDCVAKAVVLLSGTPDSFTVFHAKNCHEIHYAYFINEMKRHGMNIELVEQSEFETRFKNILEQDNQDLSAFTGFIAYLNKVGESPTDMMKYTGDEPEVKYEMRIRISSDTKFTTKALYRLGFSWPLISKDYLDKMLEMLMEFEFFD